HTRFSRDWSSDVCSSDLPAESSRRDRSSNHAHQHGDRKGDVAERDDQRECAGKNAAPPIELGVAPSDRIEHAPKAVVEVKAEGQDRKSTRLNSSHVKISY